MNGIKVNPPWVELDDRYSGDGTYVVSINEISAVYGETDNMYKHGILLKNGAWLENISDESLSDLKAYLMGEAEEILFLDLF